MTRPPHWMGEVEEQRELDRLEWEQQAQRYEDDDERRANARYSDERSESWPSN